MFVPGGLRVGHRASASGPTAWMHVNCMSAARWRTVTPRTLEGWDSLAAIDKARMCQYEVIFGSGFCIHASCHMSLV